MRLNVRPLLLLLTIALTAAQAQQQVLFDQKLSQRFVLHASDPGASQPVFQKLAEGQNRPVSSVEITVSFEQIARVVRTDAKHIQTMAEGKNFKVSGDVYYKGFDMGGWLIPDEMSFTGALLAGRKENIPVSGRDIVKIRNGNSERAEHSYVDSTHSDFQYTLSQHAFSHAGGLAGFQDRIALVNGYYQASADLEVFHQRLMTVNPSDLDRLDFQNEILRTVENDINRLEGMHFDQELGLSSFDPLKFIPRFDALRNEAFAKRNAINDTKSHLYVDFYNVALDLQARGKRQQARTYFSKSLHENPLFAPAAYQLALMDFNEGNYSNADEQGSDIVNNMNPDPDIRRLTTDLLNRTYRQYIGEAEQFIGQKKYDDALTVLDRASRLCRRVSGISCLPAMDLNYRKAHNGKYQAFLDKARSAIQTGNLQNADTYVQDALNYQNRHAAEIPNAGDALAIQKGIRQKRYDNFMESGRTKLKQQQYEKALDEFDSADELLYQYSLAPHPEMETLKKQAAKPYLLDLIRKGRYFASNNNLGEARKLSKSIGSQQMHYGLQNDAAINKEYGELKSAIFSQECVNAQISLDGYYRQMHDAILKKDYIEADNQFKNADRVLQDYADCSLNSGTLRAEHDSILPAYVYQALTREVISEQAAGRYKEAFGKYQDADTYYHRYEVSKFSIVHQPLAELAAAKCNDEFLIFLGNNFRSRKDYESSLQVYKTLLQRGISVSYYKDALYQLGMELAIRDKKVNPSGNPKKEVLAYTSGDSKLKKLYKGYLKGWKK